MSDRISGTSVYLLPGMSIKIKSPVNVRNNHGYFVAGEGDIPSSILSTFNDNYQGPIRGFVVENGDIGEITSTNASEAAVIYTHKKAEKNAIWFFAATGQRGVVNVVSVPIHDHSSIVQGGPAFGTYFSDDESEGGGTTE